MKNTLFSAITPGIILIIIFSLVWIPALSARQEDITHKVSVDLMLLPVFVTQSDGSPVHGLVKEDFELSINGQPVPISHFLSYEFTHQVEVQEKVREAAPSVSRPQTPTRAIFIIIDSVFNDFFAFRRARELAVDIIRNGSPGDMYFVLENNAAGGPRYISGPENSHDETIKRINELKLPSSKWSKNVFLTREYNYEADSDTYDPVEVSGRLKALSNDTRQMEQEAYKNQALHFATFLSKFKYALKTITRPKVVFLLSEGIAASAFKNMNNRTNETVNYSFGASEKNPTDDHSSTDVRLFSSLIKTIRAINEGGSVVYTVNPGRPKQDSETSGEMSLRFIAHESGGQYIAGKDTEKIITRIKDVTSAYYEIAFVPSPEMDKNLDISLKSKRPGLTVSTFRQTERVKPYYRMEPMEKKLFALNMVTGGSWSRLMGKVVRVNYKKLRAEKSGDSTTSMIQVDIPPKMADKPLDIFVIRVDPITKKADIEFQPQTVKERANLIIKGSKNTSQFFVIIEPVFSYCIYNQL